MGPGHAVAAHLPGTHAHVHTARTVRTRTGAHAAPRVAGGASTAAVARGNGGGHGPYPRRVEVAGATADGDDGDGGDARTAGAAGRRRADRESVRSRARTADGAQTVDGARTEGGDGVRWSEAQIPRFHTGNHRRSGHPRGQPTTFSL